MLGRNSWKASKVSLSSVIFATALGHLVEN